MKKIALLLLITFQVLSLHAQQSIKFKIGYKPNTTYKIGIVQKTNSSISYGADMEPMNQESVSDIAQTMKTGKFTGSTMPMTIALQAGKDSDAAAIMPNGATIYGKISQENSVQVDSLNAPGMPEQAKSTILTMMKGMANQYVVPERTVKVGETFTVNTPMDVPMGPVTMHMDTKTTYKLTKVEGKKAYFDLNMIIDMKADAGGQEMKGTGKGTGSLIYDIDNNFFSQQDTVSDSVINFEAQGMKMSITNKQDSKVNVQVLPN